MDYNSVKTDYHKLEVDSLFNYFKSFSFKNGKIESLKIVVSPKASVAPDLKLEGLAVDDIGRLALAAWPVV